jgi:hypothetical protein
VRGSAADSTVRRARLGRSRRSSSRRRLPGGLLPEVFHSALDHGIVVVISDRSARDSISRHRIAPEKSAAQHVRWTEETAACSLRSSMTTPEVISCNLGSVVHGYVGASSFASGLVLFRVLGTQSPKTYLSRLPSARPGGTT